MKCFKISVLALLCLIIVLGTMVSGNMSTGLIGVTGARYSSVVNEHTTFQMSINSSSVVTDTITLINGDGSSTPNSTVTVFKGSNLPTVIIPEKTGFVFSGYYTEENGGTCCYDKFGVGLVSYSNLPITKTLYAHWLEVK